MARTTFSGPIASGTNRYPGVTDGAVNVGLVALSQTGTITQNSTTTVDLTFTVPAGAQLVDFLVDVLTAYDSVTSATATGGTASTGTQYFGAVNAKTPARVRPTYTAAQLLAMSNVTTNTSVVVSIAVVGATTAGLVRVTLQYVQN